MADGADDDAFISLGEVKDFLIRAGEDWEVRTGGNIDIDYVVVEEGYNEALKTLRRTDMQNGPSEFKQAGHFAFWFRKLKPAHIMWLKSSVVEDPCLLYVNEYLAFVLGAAILEKAGQQIIAKPQFTNDFIVTMRYNSYSPHAMAMIYTLMLA